LRIAALVHPVLKGRIREALAPGDLFLDARSWDDLSEIAATRQVDLAVIDPAAFGRSAIAAAADFASAFPGLPIIVYTVASPTAAETIIKLSEHGVSHALLHPYEGSPAKIRKELQHTAIEKKYDAEYITSPNGWATRILGCWDFTAERRWP